MYMYMDTFLCVCMYYVQYSTCKFCIILFCGEGQKQSVFSLFYSAPSEVSVESVGSREGGSVGGASDGRGSSGRLRQIEKLATFDNYEQYQLIMSEVREGRDGRERGEGGREGREGGREGEGEMKYFICFH